MLRQLTYLSILHMLCPLATAALAGEQPNIVFVLTDDQRWDAVAASGNARIRTPHLDRMSREGTRFRNAFVTLAICSPSRAACLTGRYGSSNGVTSVGIEGLNEGELTFASALRAAGYRTGVAGKWHLKTSPHECGFDFVSTCWSNGPWYDRKFTIDGQTRIMPGFVDDVVADESIRFIQQAQAAKTPFVLWLCTQVPHMDHRFNWPAKDEYLRHYNNDEMPLAETWQDDLAGKPEYLKTSRNRLQALEYGYDDPEAIRKHTRDYYAAVEQMDAAVGRVLDELNQSGLDENTWVIFMGDNGWMMGEHGMTSKVLPYEESMRVPMAIRGPDTSPRVVDDLVLNIDLTATIYEIAGVKVPESLHGRSLLPLVLDRTPADWRTSFLYEAPTPQLGSQPLWAVRNHRWKYVETQTSEQPSEFFRELYDLQVDPSEQTNVADRAEFRVIVEALANELRKHQRKIGCQPLPAPLQRPDGRVSHEEPVRTDIHISGIYPHLTTYGIYSQNGGHHKRGHDECGIGALVPWAGKLWMVNYAPHQPNGSEHKLFSIDPDLSQPMTIHPESVGGTPAGRMIHAESKQLLIAHYLIDEHGKVRVISPKDMPMRVTAIARHLTDPANQVYYIDMEGAIWEANVHTLAVTQLFKKPVPGWHGKGGYTSQGRLVVANNGELHVGDYRDVLVGGAAKHDEERGVLAEYDGQEWRIVERRQFTDVTGPQGISGGSDANDPIWTIGWDRRSVRLKVLDEGVWHTYRLPKAAMCNDASHGWYTEWPRIREITNGRWMMDMHGMFFSFPQTFSSRNSAGIKPIGSHLRYIPDFCGWNGKLVLASDETSIQGNRLAGQPQSNLWFGDYEDLQTWGPASGVGGPWLGDEVAANMPSDPFLIAGFDRRIVHLGVGRNSTKIEDRAMNDPVIFRLEVDRNGDATWSDLASVKVPRLGYVAHYLPANLDAVWLRFRVDQDCLATAFLHQTSATYRDGTTAESQKLFAGLAEMDETNAYGALLYAAKRNRNLQLITSDDRYFEFTKSGFQFKSDQPDTTLKKLIHIEPEFTVDDASVILKSEGRTMRLPKGDPGLDLPFRAGWPRMIREVESERHLANIHGTFYEVPLIKNGQPPAFHLMRPVSSHRKQITDFCSWNGLLVLAGVRADAVADGHVYIDQEQQVGLWFGGIDDLWKLGKPVGTGGPWKKTLVKAGQVSDPYLMWGYDQKTMVLSQEGQQSLTVSVEVDITGHDHWVPYGDFEVVPHQETRHPFPAAFSANWIRLTSSAEAVVTAILEYR